MKVEIVVKTCKYCKMVKPDDQFFTRFMCKRCRTTRGYESNKAYKRRHKEKIRFDNLRYAYSISENEYKKLEKQQDSKCAICGISKIENGKYLCVDHRHSDGKVRGLLCHKCNWLLGHARDSVEILKNAITYIETDED